MKFLLLLPLLFVVLLITEAGIAMIGKREQFVNPKRELHTFGISGKKLNYVILGDSTSAGQGAPYEKGIAIQTTNHLAKNYSVSMINLSIAGARVKDVLDEQLPRTASYHPDIILISIGANDVTHLTSLTLLEKDLYHIVDTLKKNNPNVTIIVTASPDMGAPPRLLQPLRLLAGLRTYKVNDVFKKVAAHHHILLAPIADQTGDKFRKNPQLFSSDKFHPNEQGYALFIKVIINALDFAISSS